MGPGGRLALLVAANLAVGWALYDGAAGGPHLLPQALAALSLAAVVWVYLRRR
ncbi:hypothetical protein [Oceanithermus sp.]|uniref:hypothetical protein n=1 Tax=Oceanithermus sp. TaxID=2268145 RepID=UPI0025D6434B|nr:hypothetical protein [Oceanithermus sp.]